MTTLLSPITIGGDLKLKNRIALAPLTRARSGVDGIPKQWNVDYYTQRASAGLIISEGAIISEQGNGWADAPKIYADEHVQGWKAVTDSVHAAGGVIFCQLWHMGRTCHTSFHGLQPVSASDVKVEGDGVHGGDYKKHPYEVPRALTKEEIAKTVEDYRHAAQCAKEAGFDGIQLHAANGYLIDQFLQSKTNKRTDDYGGSPEKRYRFLGEVIDAVATVFPINRVAVRLAPNGAFNDMGSPDNHETFTYALSQLNKYDLAFVDMLDGLAFGFHNVCPQFKAYDARKVYHGTLMCNCGYTKETADGAIGTGCVDLVGFGRPYIANPDLVERFTNNWPLAPCPDVKYWFMPPYHENPTECYSDFPPYKTEA